jgi:hypothetical protein
MAMSGRKKIAVNVKQLISNMMLQGQMNIVIRVDQT